MTSANFRLAISRNEIKLQPELLQEFHLNLKQDLTTLMYNNQTQMTMI